MKTLAKAIIQAVAFLELSPNDVVNDDAAVAAIEQIGAILDGCTPEEHAALAEAAMEELNAQTAAEAPEAVLDFYENFMEDLGLEEEVDDSDAADVDEHGDDEDDEPSQE